MIFDWFRNRDRKELLEQPFPEEWLPILEDNVGLYPYLSPEHQERLREYLTVFLHEKSWEGCGGQEITDEVRVTVSANACLLLLGLEHDYFANVESILVYPTDYLAKQRTMGPDGVMREGPSHRLGEAWTRGPIVLSWADVKLGSMNAHDGHNVVLHEFAHKLDMREGGPDGVPRLHEKEEYDEWAEVMSAEYQALVHNVAHGKHTLIDPYGATNAGEFFAVITECFFEKPRQMQRDHPHLYAVLLGYYRQDPAARLIAHLGEVEEADAASSRAVVPESK